MNERDEKLDLIRGSSALLVMVGHARNFLMVDSGQLVANSPAIKGFYLVTSLHHQAVMVFFVLSGYFVGGSVLGSLERERFSWMNYSIARLSRLWVVLLPALLLTLLLDLTGGRMSPAAYHGQFYTIFDSGPNPVHPVSHDVVSFLGNLGFLQTICVPVFGSNGPLWSLAYEFWYYVLFALLSCGIVKRGASKTSKAACMLLFGVLVWLLPGELISSGLIWLMGVGVWRMARYPEIKLLASGWIWKLVGAIFFGIAVLGAKAGMIPVGDFVVGATFAIWMPSLLGAWRRPSWYQRLSIGLSEISFSLYIIHFPIMFLIVSQFLKGAIFQPTFHGMSWFTGVNILCLLASYLFWLVFESRTPTVRKWMQSIVQSFRS